MFSNVEPITVSSPPLVLIIAPPPVAEEAVSVEAITLLSTNSEPMIFIVPPSFLIAPPPVKTKVSSAKSAEFALTLLPVKVEAVMSIVPAL